MQYREDEPSLLEGGAIEVNYERILAQYTDTYLDDSQCQALLAKRWPKFSSLLPPKWWYPTSPLRQWLHYSENVTYETALTLLQEELLAISERFPDKYKNWIGSLSVPKQFWAKRFESVIIFLLIRSGLNVQAIDVKSSNSNHEVDILVVDKTESVHRFRILLIKQIFKS